MIIFQRVSPQLPSIKVNEKKDSFKGVSLAEDIILKTTHPFSSKLHFFTSISFFMPFPSFYPPLFSQVFFITSLCLSCGPDRSHFASYMCLSLQVSLLSFPFSFCWRSLLQKKSSFISLSFMHPFVLSVFNPLFYLCTFGSVDLPTVYQQCFQMLSFLLPLSLSFALSLSLSQSSIPLHCFLKLSHFFIFVLSLSLSLSRCPTLSELLK